MKTKHPVRVFETAEGWHVGVNGGHYAGERTKEEAILDARQLAGEVGELEIAVCNLAGEIVETIQLEGRPVPLRQVTRRLSAFDTRLLRQTQKMRLFGPPEQRFP